MSVYTVATNYSWLQPSLDFVSPFIDTGRRLQPSFFWLQQSLDFVPLFLDASRRLQPTFSGCNRPWLRATLPRILDASRRLNSRFLVCKVTILPRRLQPPSGTAYGQSDILCSKLCIRKELQLVATGATPLDYITRAQITWIMIYLVLYWDWSNPSSVSR